jgi:hypothetical protein
VQGSWTSSGTVEGLGWASEESEESISWVRGRAHLAQVGGEVDILG